MEKCSCYDVMQYFRTDCMDNIIPTKTVSVCNGTKEREECFCGGNPAKCDFYSEKRKYTCESYRKKDGWCTERQGPCHCPVDGDASKCTFDTLEDNTTEGNNMIDDKCQLGNSGIFAAGLADALKMYSSGEIATISIPNHNPGKDILKHAPVLANGVPIGVVESYTEKSINCFLWTKYLPVGAEIEPNGLITAVVLGASADSSITKS